MAERLTRVPHVRKIWSSNSWQVKSYTALQTVLQHRHRHCNCAIVVSLGKALNVIASIFEWLDW